LPHLQGGIFILPYLQGGIFILPYLLSIWIIHSSGSTDQCSNSESVILSRLISIPAV
jgi:hypothetical protein